LILHTDDDTMFHVLVRGAGSEKKCNSRHRELQGHAAPAAPELREGGLCPHCQGSPSRTGIQSAAASR
jgi:hypothetical protein